MKTNIHLLYNSTLAKYRKFKTRFDKNIKNGQFYSYTSNKQHQVVSRLERLYKRLLQLKWQLRIATATGVIATSLAFSPANAQQLGPFKEMPALNPFFSPPGTTRNGHPAVVDIDNDGDLDIFVGSSYGRVAFIRNDGTPEAPYFTRQYSTSNPANGIDVGNHATPSFADLDGDGDYDLILGRYYQYEYYPFPNLRYHENTGTPDNPIFSTTPTSNPHPADDLFSDTYNSHPAFVDIDDDGDLDAFVGGDMYGYSPFSRKWLETVKFWRNDGTQPTPLFTQENGSSNPISIVNPEFGGTLNLAAPAFADIDDDGDIDLFIGDDTGAIRFFRNDGTAASPSFAAEATGSDNPFNGISVNANASPEFADFDNDGDLDMIAGSDRGYYGSLHYFENTGSASSPVFVERLTTDNPLQGFNLDYDAAPVSIDFDGDGYLDVLIGGKYEPTIEYYKNNQDGTFSRVSASENPFDQLLNTGYYRPTPAFADIDADGDLDLLVAIENQSGGPSTAEIKFYQNDGNDNFSLQSTTPITTSQNYTVFALTVNDFDGDGDFDAIIGSNNVDYSSASFLYIRNDGTATAPNFVPQPTSDPPFEDFELVPGFTAYPKPVMVDLDHDGDLDVTIGVHGSPRSGQLAFFENDGTGVLTEQTAGNDPFGIDVGYDSHPAFIDVDNDGDLDILVGNGQGEMSYIENQNLPPETTINNTQVSFTAENGSVELTPGLVLSDDTDDTIISASASIVSNYVNGEDTLFVAEMFNITSSFDETTGVLTLSGSASLAEYEQVLQTLSYNNTNENPDTSPRQVQVAVTDFDATNPLSDNIPETVIEIDVIDLDPPAGDLNIYNAVSPNGDSHNDFWEIENLSTPNKIVLYNRWGDLVKTLSDYDGETANNLLDDLPTATYFYEIESDQGNFKGYLVIKK